MSPRRFVSYPELKARYGLPWSRQHVDRMIKAGKFPGKFQLTEHRVGWWSDHIESWLETRVAKSPVAGADQGEFNRR